ncbi:MAG: ectonucleotide pyrophosphatase/phosphodiesterase [Deltaproteobacteria bacterium]
MDRPAARGARCRLACCLGLVLSGACSTPTVGAPAVATPAPPAREPPGPIRHAIVITIDGLLPEAYRSPEAHELRVPVLRRLLAEGASSTGALSVFPAATYPAHTAIASGVNPRQHGIVTNRVFDPLGQNPGVWHWYAEDVKVPRLWDIARAAGYSTALDSWPVTVGANATYHVPEYWRTWGSEEWKLLRTLSTPGLLERVTRTYPSFAPEGGPGGLSDEAITDIELEQLATTPPHLSFLHLPQVDSAQHEHGLWSAEARAAIENADRQVGRVLETIERAGLREQTALVVASERLPGAGGRARQLFFGQSRQLRDPARRSSRPRL